MRILKFDISNFKGIQRATIGISTVAPGNVITVIGLNESGKTTVLEALSHFVSVDTDTSSIVNTVAPKQRPIDLIPKAKKSNFTGQIRITASLKLDDDDIQGLSNYLKIIKNVEIDIKSITTDITVTRVYAFKDSDPSPASNLWTFSFSFKKLKGTKAHFADGTNQRDIWLSAIDYLATRFPKIVYFPTFLFDVPDRIYLEDLPEGETTAEKAIANKYFKQVLQDVADSLNDDVSIKRHIVDRIARKRTDFPNPLTFVAAFLGMDESSQIRAVVNRLGGAITKTVFSAWNEIFDHGITGKSVQVEWG